jgi:uncharacterized integral membrane protein
MTDDPLSASSDDVSAEPAAGGDVVVPSGEPAAALPPGRGPRQTLAGRVWVAIAAAAILLVLVIIFIAENSHPVTVSFLGARGHISEALALLIAVVVGITITLLVGSARIVQLTLEIRRHRRRLRTLS